MTATQRADALRIAHAFIADPDERAQAKAQLCEDGLPRVADMIDGAVFVSLALIELDAAMKEPK